MVFLSSVVWIVESVLLINIVLLALGISNGNSGAMSIVLIFGFEFVRYATNNFGTKPRQDIWWYQAGCDSWACSGTTCDNIECSDLGCDAVNDLGCENISEIGCSDVVSTGCDTLSDCDCG